GRRAKNCAIAKGPDGETHISGCFDPLSGLYGRHTRSDPEGHMLRTPGETAIILALVLKRSGQNRARLSAKTIKLAGGRKNLRGAFVVELADALAEYGWTISELDIGGFGVIRTKSLEAAKAVAIRSKLSAKERLAL